MSRMRADRFIEPDKPSSLRVKPRLERRSPFASANRPSGEPTGLPSCASIQKTTDTGLREHPSNRTRCARGPRSSRSHETSCRSDDATARNNLRSLRRTSALPRCKVTSDQRPCWTSGPPSTSTSTSIPTSTLDPRPSTLDPRPSTSTSTSTSTLDLDLDLDLDPDRCGDRVRVRDGIGPLSRLVSRLRDRTHGQAPGALAANPSSSSSLLARVPTPCE